MCSNLIVILMGVVIIGLDKLMILGCLQMQLLNYAGRDL